MALSLGPYEKKQFDSPSRIVRWSHGSRFKVAAGLAAGLHPRRLLDYGCGDGTLLRLAAPALDEAVGADYSAEQVRLTAELCAGDPKIRIVGTEALGPADEGRYDAVFCMEVLEHCLPDAVERILSDLTRYAAPRGAIVISVPIEIGPVALGKHAMRRLLGRAKIGDYQFTDAYSPSELARMVFAGPTTAIERPVHEGGHPHKGFNWRAFEVRLREKFAIESRQFSPLPWSRGLASSQVWFVCRNVAR